MTNAIPNGILNLEKSKGGTLKVKETLFLCPKCGNDYIEEELDEFSHNCEFCNTPLIKTKYKWRAIVKQEILEEYVFNNEMFDKELYEKRLKEEEIRAEESRAFCAQLAAKNDSNTNKPKCPTCGSTNIKKIGNLERGASVGLFGLFSSKIGKTMQCKNCSYKW